MHLTTIPMFVHLRQSIDLYTHSPYHPTPFYLGYGQKMRQRLVVGNWKLNGSRDSILKLVCSIKAGLDSLKNIDVVICPSFVFLQLAADQIRDTALALGSQDVSDQERGAFTGEVSALMLIDMKCQYAIVGHSERRHIYHETDELIALKFAAARRVGLIPILCVGELEEERDTGNTNAVIARQLDTVIKLEGITALQGAIIAYEPVWAIGTGKAATPKQAQDVHAFIRSRIAAQDTTIADTVCILYGGSVKSSNANDLFAQTDIDGGLIGSASLQVDEFLSICHAANNF